MKIGSKVVVGNLYELNGNYHALFKEGSLVKCVVKILKNGGHRNITAEVVELDDEVTKDFFWKVGQILSSVGVSELRESKELKYKGLKTVLDEISDTF
jgi:hypothetical protein